MIRLHITDECCSLTTQLALVLHFETMAVSLLICRSDAASGSQGINRGATELRGVCLPVSSQWSNDRWHDCVIYQRKSTRQTSPYPQDRVSYGKSNSVSYRWDDPVAHLLKPSGKPSPKRDLSPVAGAYLCEHVSHCHSESSAGPFFPRAAHSSFPPNPKGLRGRAMTKVHATDGKRSPVLLLIALRWPFRVVIGCQGIVAALLSICTCPHILTTYDSECICNKFHYVY